MNTQAFFTVLLISICLLAIALAGMAIRILVLKKGKFISLHLSGNKEMKKKGITCATSTMKKDEKEYKAVKINIS